MLDFQIQYGLMYLDSLYSADQRFYEGVLDGFIYAFNFYHQEEEKIEIGYDNNRRQHYATIIATGQVIYSKVLPPVPFE